MCDDQEISSNNTDVTKYQQMMVRVPELPWFQRKIPFYLVNPCTQPYDDIAKIMIDLYDGGKIKKLVIDHGVGDVIPSNASVYLHYSCYIEEKKTQFDSSLLRSPKPKHYQMGGGYLFPGFEIALSSMREKETAQFLIHSDYAFGKMGCPPRIPGNVPVMVVINVTGYINCGDVTLRRDKDVEFLPFEQKLKIAQAHSALAVDYYKHVRIKMAFHHFREAQYVLDEQEEGAKEEERQNFLQKSFVNQLMCLSHPKYLNPKRLLEVATRAEKEIPNLMENNAKFHYCCGIAFTHLQDFASATNSFKKAQMLSPFLPRLGQAVKYLQERAGKALLQEKLMWRGAFSRLGYSPLSMTDDHTESEEIKSARIFCNETLARYFKSDNLKSLALGTGFTDVERKILAVEAEKLGLIYKQYLENSKVYVEIMKRKYVKT